MTPPSSIHTLVLFANAWTTFSYYDDWKCAFESSDDFHAESWNICQPDSAVHLASRVKDYDLIVLLHSTNADTLKYIRPLIPVLLQRSGRLLSFVGNEVNLPGAFLGDKIALLRELRADFIATQLPLQAGQYLYAELPDSKILPVPHALNTERFRPVVPPASRPIDIGVRSYEYLPWMGDLERNRIIDYFAATPFVPPLRTNINTTASGRLSPDDWAGFLNQCKATVATEAGTYFLERNDATMKRIVAYLQDKQGASQTFYNRIRRIAPRLALPLALRKLFRALLGRTAMEQSYHQMAKFGPEIARFEEIFSRFYQQYPDPVSGKCISSRHFDAAGTKTLQIMFPGHFNGILLPDVHYLSLARDFSNIDDVLARFRDPSFVARMVDTTYDFICSEHTYPHRLRTLRNQLDPS